MKRKPYTDKQKARHQVLRGLRSGKTIKIDRPVRPEDVPDGIPNRMKKGFNALLFSGGNESNNTHPLITTDIIPNPNPPESVKKPRRSTVKTLKEVVSLFSSAGEAAVNAVMDQPTSERMSEENQAAWEAAQEPMPIIVDGNPNPEPEVALISDDEPFLEENQRDVNTTLECEKPVNDGVDNLNERFRAAWANDRKAIEGCEATPEFRITEDTALALGKVLREVKKAKLNREEFVTALGFEYTSAVEYRCQYCSDKAKAVEPVEEENPKADPVKKYEDEVQKLTITKNEADLEAARLLEQEQEALKNNTLIKTREVKIKGVGSNGRPKNVLQSVSDGYLAKMRAEELNKELKKASSKLDEKTAKAKADAEARAAKDKLAEEVKTKKTELTTEVDAITARLKWLADNAVKNQPGFDFNANADEVASDIPTQVAAFVTKARAAYEWAERNVEAPAKKKGAAA